MVQLTRKTTSVGPSLSLFLLKYLNFLTRMIEIEIRVHHIREDYKWLNKSCTQYITPDLIKLCYQDP